MPTRTTFTRRQLLTDTGLGFGSLALAAMLDQEQSQAQESRLDPRASIRRIAPKAKSVIWLFMIGGTSHMESFDPKPALNKYAGKTFAETPYGDVLKSPYMAV